MLVGGRGIGRGRGVLVGEGVLVGGGGRLHSKVWTDTHMNTKGF